MAERMKQRRATADEWAAANPILAAGEIGVIEIPDGTDRIKIGDGITAWAELPVFRVDVADLAVRATDADSADNAKKLDDFDSSVIVAADTVVVRTDDGRIKTAPPEEPDDAVTKQYADSATAPATKVEVFTTSDVWVKETDAIPRVVEIICIGAGAAGRTTVDQGSAGGGRMRTLYPAAFLPSTVPVVVGVGGATANTAGSDSTFGAYCGAYGGQVGSGGMPYWHRAGSQNGGADSTRFLEDAGGYSGGSAMLAGAGGGAVRTGGHGTAGGSSGSLAGGSLGSSSGGATPGGAGLSRSGSGYGGSGGGSSWVSGSGPGGIPGGGGGCSASSGTIGPGARGEVLVITYF